MILYGNDHVHMEMAQLSADLVYNEIKSITALIRVLFSEDYFCFSNS